MPEHRQRINGEQQVGGSAELQRSLAEMARCLNELTRQLHGMPAGDEPSGAFEETRPLMKALNAQLDGDGAEAWARALGEAASDDEIEHALQSFGGAQNLGAAQDFGRRLRSQAEELCANVADFERVMQRAVAAAQSGWQARLDADLAAAREAWDERIKSSMESSAQRAAGLVTQSSQETVLQLEEAMRERMAAMSKSFTDAGSEAESRLAAVRASFDEEMGRAQDMLAQVNATATSVDDQAARLAAITEIAQEELKRRGSAMLEWHTAQLAQHAKQSADAWTGRLQAGLEGAGERIIAKLGVEFEQQLNARLERTRGILERLENEGRRVESLLRVHLGRVEKFSEQAVEAVLERLEKAGTEWESRIANAAIANAGAETARGPVTNHEWLAGSSLEPAELARAIPEAESRAQQPGVVSPGEKEVKTIPQKIETAPSLGSERRVIRRLKISRPLLVRPEDPAYKEVVEITRNASRNGVYFTTAAKHYYPGMHVRVTLGYTPNDPCNVASFGKVLRLDPLENGDWGVAVRILLR